MNARLHFRLKSEQPGAFGKAEKVEVASDDGFYHTELSLENGGLMRQNAHTVMATLEIDKDAASLVLRRAALPSGLRRRFWR